MKNERLRYEKVKQGYISEKEIDQLDPEIFVYGEEQYYKDML